MESKKSNSVKVLGAITIACAIIMLGFNYFTKENPNSLIMPFILLCLGITFITQKQKEYKNPVKIDPKRRKIILSILSIVLITGIITFFLTAFSVISL